MSTVHEDTHGLYVKVDGLVFRPQPGWRNGFYAHMHVRPSRSSKPPVNPVRGAKVNARHLSGTDVALVEGKVWFGHGSYFARRADERGIVPTLPSTICWEPPRAARCPVINTHSLTGEPVPCVGPVQYGSGQCRFHLERSTP